MGGKSWVLCTVLAVATSGLLGMKIPTKICYEKVGCFNNGPPFGPPTRRVPGPQAPEDVCDSVVIFTRDTQNVTLTIFPEISPELDDLFVPSRPTYILCHGFLGSGYNKWLSDMAEALLEKFDANIIIPDWQKGAQNVTYFQAVSNTRMTAAVLDLLVQHLVSLGGNTSSFHLIGHSLGAHIMSYLAKISPTKIKRLTGLDPTKPLFEGLPVEARFSPGDAEYTEAVHTNADFGIFERVADVDFYFNGGILQPMCFYSKELSSNVAMNITRKLVICSHRLATTYYTQAIKNPNCFRGWPALVENNRVIIKEEDCTKVNCVPLKVEENDLLPAEGAFAILTILESPYCIVG